MGSSDDLAGLGETANPSGVTRNTHHAHRA